MLLLSLSSQCRCCLPTLMTADSLAFFPTPSAQEYVNFNSFNGASYTHSSGMPQATYVVHYKSSTLS